MAYKLLFVCLGNICRSPAAENIMNVLIAEAGLTDKIQCDSAGTSSYHIGSPPDHRMAARLKQRDLPASGHARQFERSDFAEFDLILAMDKDNYRQIMALDREGRYGDKVKLMCSYARHHQLKEVPDPYYGGQAGFDRVIDLLLDACSGLLEEVKAQL
ncbi:MAG: low molecular weight protein-tyrosine-phosphatase [Snowella sp.]|nr:low molecular weight protein-tyrosine-phosphatase [Snowella sp.]